MPRPAETRSATSPWRILVVDENSEIARGLVYLLEIMGHQALYLSNPHHTLTKVDEFRPDVAFIDIGAASPEGNSLALVLRDHYAPHELRLVALSTYGDTRMSNASMTAGFDAYLSKPVKERDVETVLGVVFDKRLW
jgi:PleD family two-component response regulator